MLDAPAGTDGLWTPYEWSETITLHMINHGNAYLRLVRNGAGAIVQLHPIHPAYVIPRWPAVGEFAVGGKWYRVTDPITGRSADYDGLDILQIPGMSSDGLAGISVLSAARINLGGSIASERASARVMSRGALMGGVATPEEDGELDPEELEAARAEILQHTAGYEHAGGIAIVNRALKITPWTMTAKDAQFLESRQFGVEDIARWLGVPPHLLMQTDKQTSWGTGVAEQNRGLARYTLPPWTSRIEQRLTRLLPPGVRAAYDYGRLTRPVHEVEVSLVLQELAAGVITRDEARSRLGYPPDGEAIPNAA
jgi:HK97 family phage portal protein